MCGELGRRRGGSVTVWMVALHHKCSVVLDVVVDADVLLVMLSGH